MLSRTRSISRWCLVGGLLLFSLNLQAKNLNVRCGSGDGSDPTSITAALTMLNPNVPNTRKIFGVCQENVVISGFNRLTLIGRQGATVVDDSGGAAQTFLVVDSTDVYFQTLWGRRWTGWGCKATTSVSADLAAW